MITLQANSDNQILDFNFTQPKSLSSISYNTVDQQHSPVAYDKIESQPASGNYFRTPSEDIFLGPAPRSQLGVPTKKVYKGNTKKYYKPIIGNANFIRGNQFGVVNPYQKAGKFTEVVSIPSVDIDKNGPIDYLGNDAKIVIRNNDPFYPYPSQHLLESNDYWAYNHDYQYLNGQPIYNYPHGKMEGSSRGKYDGGKGFDPYNPLENFAGCKKCSCDGPVEPIYENFAGCSKCQEGNMGFWWIFGFIVFIIILILCFSYAKK